MDSHLKKTRQHHTGTLTDEDNADDLVLFANTPDQAESKLHSLD